MPVEIIPGDYKCGRGNAGVVVGKTNQYSIKSMRQIVDQVSPIVVACNNRRGDICPGDCLARILLDRAQKNVAELRRY